MLLSDDLQVNPCASEETATFCTETRDISVVLVMIVLINHVPLYLKTKCYCRLQPARDVHEKKCAAHFFILKSFKFWVKFCVSS